MANINPTRKQVEAVRLEARNHMRQFVRHYAAIGDESREAQAIETEAAWKAVEAAYDAVMAAQTDGDLRTAVQAYQKAQAVLEAAFMALTGDRLDDEVRH